MSGARDSIMEVTWRWSRRQTDRCDGLHWILLPLLCYFYSIRHYEYFSLLNCQYQRSWGFFILLLASLYIFRLWLVYNELNFIFNNQMRERVQRPLWFRVVNSFRFLWRNYIIFTPVLSRCLPISLVLHVSSFSAESEILCPFLFSHDELFFWDKFSCPRFKAHQPKFVFFSKIFLPRWFFLILAPPSWSNFRLLSKIFSPALKFLLAARACQPKILFCSVCTGCCRSDFVRLLLSVLASIFSWKQSPPVSFLFCFPSLDSVDLVSDFVFVERVHDLIFLRSDLSET
jgi:hypothetical protein